MGHRILVRLYNSKLFVGKATIILIVTLISAAAFAQKPGLYFTRITFENGLSNNKVNCILQDKRGFIWIGTEDGLNRYDGQYFKVFRNSPGDTSGISGNIITDLKEDENGILWIATADGGLSKYDYRLPAKKQFKQYKHIQRDSTTIPVNIINALLEDNGGYLWLATSGFSVLRFNKKTERFEMPVSKGTKTALALCVDANNILWVGRQGGSALKINTGDLSYKTDERYNNLYAKLPHASITALFMDEEKNMWFGSWDNVLYRYNSKTQKEETFKQTSEAASFPNDEITSFAADKNGRLWMGGRYFGLTIYNKQQNKFFNYQYDPSREGSISGNQINCIYIDRAGLAWIGTSKGLSVYNPSQQLFEQTFLPRQKKDVIIYDFYKDEKNTLWLATSAGIFMKAGGSNNFELKKIIYKGEPLSVTKFFKDKDGTFYLGTNYSLFVYYPATNAISLLPNTEKDMVMNGIIDSRIVSIIRDTIDSHPALLVSPYGHYLAYYDLVDKRWVSRADSVKKIIPAFNLKDNLIRKIYKAPNGEACMATAKFGLGLWQKKANPYVDYMSNDPESKKSISSNNVYDMLGDKKGNLWVSTYGGGLNYFNFPAHTFSHVISTSNLTEGIQTDKKDNVWMISNGNLHKYEPNLKTNTSFVLPDLEKSGGVRGNIYKDSDGRMYVAGTNFFIQFNPDTTLEKKEQPKAFLTDFKIFNNSSSELLSQKNIQLRYFQNYFTIEFSAPEFSGNKVEYSYKLEGLEKEWTDAGNRNFANYSNLPGGDYVFKVRAANKKGYWGKDVVELNLVIIPPFWERWWFYTLCTAAIAATVYFIYRYRLNEVLKREAIRNKIAQDLHDNLGSTLSSISIYSQVAKIYHARQKEEQLQQTLEKIGDTSSEMISEMSDIVWAINPKNDHMSTIIQRMESYAKPLLQTQNIIFSFNYDSSVPELNMQMEKRKNFYLIFKEAINNVLKYSSCKNVEVNIKHKRHTIELMIADNGIGFDVNKIKSAAAKSLSGNGLKNMSMRAEELKGKFKLESIPGKGTTVFVTFGIP